MASALAMLAASRWCGHCPPAGQLPAPAGQGQRGRLATVRLRSPLGGSDVVAGFAVRQLGASTRRSPPAAKLTEIVPGLSPPIAVTGRLIAVRLLAGDDQARPKDLAGLRVLLAVATSAALTAGLEAVQLIPARGSGRGRDLTAALRQIGKSQASQETAGLPGTP